MPQTETDRSTWTDESIGSHPRVPESISPSGARSGNPVPEASVAAMFDGIAPVYDRLNTLLTFGRDGRWRRRAVEASGLEPGGSVLDAACGTGKLAAELADRVGPFGRVLAVDLSPGMVSRGVASFADLVQLEFRVGNALALPAGDGEFDAATIAFGMRNLSDFEAGFRELRRVVRPGGRVVCLELTTPRPAWWGRLFLGTFRRVAPIGGRLFGRVAAYRYLPASLDGFPDPDRLSATMLAAGLTDIRVRRMGLRSVALHVGIVPRG
jgi:demethylmenaquinone methyltransferase/2-methoxy-6-polyprenyl-1,4-benzoquinol methylase